MINCYIQSFTSTFIDPGNEKDDLSKITGDIPKGSARRMSFLGKQMHHVLRNVPKDLETSFVYGTTYTEALALESFLESFPHASPTAFQTSIHPGGIEQALILTKQDIGPLFPLAGKQNLLIQMLYTAVTCTTPRVVVCGGEERGTWLGEFNLAHSLCFAFSMCLTQKPDGQIGRIEWTPEYDDSATYVPSLEEAVRCMRTRQPLEVATPDHGKFRVTWK